MRGHQVDMMKLMPVLWGSMCINAATACGNSIDTRGFRGVLATLVCGSAASSSGASDLSITCKIQEAEALGAAGSSWTDITNGVINGSFKLDAVALTGSGPTLYMEQMYERLDGSRKRYIRPHLTGTSSNAAASLGVRYSVNLILCDPIDTIYAVQPTSLATNNAEQWYQTAS